MRDILQDPKEIVPAPKPLSPRRFRRKLLWLLLVLGLLGGAGGAGTPIYRWVRNYQCAEKGIREKNADAALGCLQRFSPKVSNALITFGVDLRQAYLDLFNALMAERQFQKALEVAEAGLRVFSWEPAFLGNKALALFHLGRNQEAVAVFEQLLQHPQTSALQKANGVRFDLMAAEIYLGARNIEKAEAYLKKVLDTEPGNAPAHLLYARLEVTRGKFEAMANHYKKVQELDPKMFAWQDLFLLSLHYLNTNQAESFQQLFAQARRDFPTASGFHLLLAARFLKEGNYASAYYEVLFEKEAGLADAAFFEQAIHEIEKQYQTAFARQPAGPWLQPLYRFIHGKQAYESRDYAKAFAWIEQSVQQSEVHPLQQLYLGRSAAALGHVDQAIGYYGMALSKQETLAVATGELASLYLKKGAVEAAQNLWKKAVAADPYVVKISDMDARLRESKITPEMIEPSARLNEKAADSLMKPELNQIVLHQFAQLLRVG